MFFHLSFTLMDLTTGNIGFPEKFYCTVIRIEQYSTFTLINKKVDLWNLLGAESAPVVPPSLRACLQ